MKKVFFFFSLLAGATTAAYYVFATGTEAVSPSAAVASADDLTLSFTLPQTQVTVGERFAPTVSIKNKGKLPVTLVKPGDGSEVGWRTPVIHWEIEQRNRNGSFSLLPEKVYPRCGNMNPLGKGEVFSLALGSSVSFSEWIDLPPFEQAGTYRVTFRYKNDPKMKMDKDSLLLLGQSDKEAFRRLPQSTYCELKSNALLITVTNPKSPNRK